MLLAIPTEIIIFIALIVLILFAVVSGIFYTAANKAQHKESLEGQRGKEDAEMDKPRGKQSKKEQAQRNP
jgi:flagellar basal body-associated protein FliL